MSATSIDEALVATSAGLVRGSVTEHALTYRGVPYAAPPSGASRFAAPSPHEPWEGERDARIAGPTAPQPFRSRLGDLDLSPFFGAGWVRGDDYLTVDIWSPRETTAPAPVVLFVHGGAFIAGSTGGPVYDGSAFARDGVVFVTANYRLGVSGFLHVPDAPDNRGMLDIAAALRWIHDNIAQFGGDPGNVTLMGQSAGAIIVSSLLTDTTVNGLFRRAIVQSGSGTGAFTTQQAAMVSDRVGELLGRAPTAAALADVSDEDFVSVVPTVAHLDLTTPDAPRPLGGITVFGLVLDEQPARSLITAAGHIPDLLIGDNADESTLYVAPQGQLAGTTESDLLAAAALFTDRPEEHVGTYRSGRESLSLEQLRVGILSDGMFGAGTRALADAHAAHTEAATHVYRFEWGSNAVAGQLRSSHLMELPFVFDRTDVAELHGENGLLGTSAPPAALSADMHTAWVRYATLGSPGWEAASLDQRAVRRFG